ncbi:MAG: type III pantothenate kinase [Bacteroidales bacterium]|nr:type III pantothenate kinase [Bacteroidales bacterium]
MTNSGTQLDLLSASRLIIDFGNTFTKTAVFRENKLLELLTGPIISVGELESLKTKYNPQHAIIASVIDIPEGVINYLHKTFHLIQLDQHTPIPISNRYKTPDTLGSDRLAMVVAANSLFPGKNCLVIGAGTCITYDFIDHSATYYGGAISPGISLRFKALHNFTGKLPFVSFNENAENAEITGTTTEQSILSGVLIGSTTEIDGTIDKYRALYQGLQVMLTGGDMNYFKKTLKNRIFAASNLVLTGLNVILDFNVKKQ